MADDRILLELSKELRELHNDTNSTKQQIYSKNKEIDGRIKILHIYEQQKRRLDDDMTGQDADNYYDSIY